MSLFLPPPLPSSPLLLPPFTFSPRFPYPPSLLFSTHPHPSPYSGLGVTKKHSLHLGASDFLRAEVDPNSTPSSFGISAKALRDMLDHFSIAISSSATGSTSIRNENQLGWMFGKKEIRVKSWEGGSKDLSTEIRVDPGEFLDYWVEGERVDLTLPMREFRVSK